MTFATVALQRSRTRVVGRARPETFSQRCLLSVVHPFIQKETMIHVVKPKEAKHRNSFGVAFDLLAIGPQSMVTKMHYRKENVIPFHSHPNEQTGYILSGRICVLTRDSRHELGPGDPYAIRRTSSTASIIEDAEEVQVFTPPREDFL